MRRRLSPRPAPSLFLALAALCCMLSGCALPSGAPIAPHPVAIALAGIRAEVLVHGDGEIDQVGAISDDPVRIQVREATTRPSSCTRAGPREGTGS